MYLTATFLTEQIIFKDFNCIPLSNIKITWIKTCSSLIAILHSRPWRFSDRKQETSLKKIKFVTLFDIEELLEVHNANLVNYLKWLEHFTICYTTCVKIANYRTKLLIIRHKFTLLKKFLYSPDKNGAKMTFRHIFARHGIYARKNDKLILRIYK